VRRWSAGLLLASLALFTIGASIGPPHILQALGNMFWATAIIIGALAWLMRRNMAPSEGARSEGLHTGLGGAPEARAGGVG
jgi:hypothetical protein